MAQMSERELADIISRDKPGFKVLKREHAAKVDSVADAGPGGTALDRVRDLSDLRSRYLGTEGEADSDTPDPDAVDDGDEPQDEIVVIGPEEAATDPWRPGPGPKSVVVSGKERRVVAEQG